MGEHERPYYLSDILKHGTTRYLEARMLAAPNGVELYRYNTTSKEFSALLGYLHTHEREKFVWKPRDFGALVLVIVDWANADGQFCNSFWADCRAVLNLEILSDKKQLPVALESGWEYWCRPPRPFLQWRSNLLMECSFPRRWKIPQLVSNALSVLQFKTQQSVEQLVRKLEHDVESYSPFTGNDGAYGRVFGNLISSMTMYRQELVDRQLIPGRTQSVAKWHSTLSLGLQPTCHLPIRSVTEPIFADWIYAFLRDSARCRLPENLVERERLSKGTKPYSVPIASGSLVSNVAVYSIPLGSVEEAPGPPVETIEPPISVKVFWPTDATEPQVRIALVGATIPQAYLASKAPSFSDKESIVICSTADSSLKIRLTSTPAGFCSNDNETSWIWPFAAVRGSELAFTRIVRCESPKIPFGIHIPADSVLIAKLEGSQICARTLMSDVPYRLWFSEPPTLRTGNADQVSEHCFEVRGETGQSVEFECEGESVELTFVAQPLEVEIVGSRWTSSTAQGPYIGAPQIRVDTKLPFSVSIRGGPWRDFLRTSAYLQVFDEPDFVDFVGELSCSIRAGEAEARIRVRILPADSKFTLSPPRADGRRLLAIGSSHLTSLKVIAGGDGDTVAESLAVNGRVEVLLPAVDSMCRYILEMTFKNAKAVRAPLLDIRRRFWLCDGDKRMEVFFFSRGKLVTLSRKTARLLSVEADGLLAGDVFSLTVRSFLNGQSVPKIQRLPAIRAERSDSFELALGDIIDDLEYDGHHEIDFAVEEVGSKFTWRLRIVDSYFVPTDQEAHSWKLAPFSKLGEAPIWRYVLGRCLGHAPESLPILPTATDEWDALFPAFANDTVFAAPFNGTQRIGLVRMVESQMGNRLVDTATYASATVRADFEAGHSKRQELSQIWSNLRVFNSAHSFPVLRNAILDGALPVYLSFHDELRHDEKSLTRAVPADAWRSVFAALIDDTGELSLAHLMSKSAPVETLLMFGNYGKADSRLISSRSGDLATINQNFVQIIPVLNHGIEVDPLTPVSLLDFHLRLAPLLDHWRNGNVWSLQASVLDDIVMEFGTPPAEVTSWLQKYSSEGLEIWRSAICLAAAAARVVMDLALTPADRVRIRSAVISPRQVRAWENYQPLVDCLYLFSLVALNRQELG